MKKMHKILALAIAVIMILSLISLPFSAETGNTPKEEVVYVNLANDGTVNNIYVVNAFDMDSAGTVVDYGEYSSIRNMTTTANITKDGDMISVSAPEGRFYYEGTLVNKTLPWIFDFEYVLDGVICEGEEVAGKSGALKISLNISKNPEYNGDFYDTHALQVTFSLNTEKCKNIVAEGATLANVGRNKQITYTVLGGSGAAIEITADVKDFEMPSVTISGVSLKLDINIDSSLFSDKLREVINIFGNMTEGAEDLTDSLSQLETAVGTISSSTGSLNSGVSKLEQGAKSLQEGITAITGKSEELNNGAKTAFEGLCKACSMVVNMVLSENGMNTVALTPDNYNEVLSSIIKLLDVNLAYEQAYAQAEATVRMEVENRASELYFNYVEAQGESVFDMYIQSIADDLYRKVAQETVYAYYLSLGYSETVSRLSVNSIRGKELTAEALKEITDEQKQQILEGAKAALTEEEKDSIINNVAENLDEEQKKLLVNGYVDQLMVSAPILARIHATVSSVDEALSEIVALKGQLDSFNLFCDGVASYTSAVDGLLEGTDAIVKGLGELKSNTSILSSSMKKLHDSVRELNEGTSQLVEEASSFDSEDFDIKLDSEIDSILSSVTGKESKAVSFVSDKNENIDSVQFVIKTEAVSIPEVPTFEPVKPAELTLWQKILKLFGLYKG